MNKEQIRNLVKEMVEEAVMSLSRPDNRVKEDMLDFAWEKKTTIPDLESGKFWDDYWKWDGGTPPKNKKVINRIMDEVRAYVIWNTTGRPGGDFVYPPDSKPKEPVNSHRFERTDHLGNKEAVIVGPKVMKGLGYAYAEQGAHSSSWMPHSTWDFVSRYIEGRAPSRADTNSMWSLAAEEAMMEEDSYKAMEAFFDTMGFPNPGFKPVKYRGR